MKNIAFSTFVFLSSVFVPILVLAGQNPGGGGGKGATTSKSSPFSENKQWELRLSDRLRSTVEIHLISPVSGANVDGDKITFEWTGGKKQKIFLGLMNNENKEVFYKEVTGNKVILSVKELGLTPGLYYWVLENEEDVLNVGKLFFRKK